MSSIAARFTYARSAPEGDLNHAIVVATLA